MASLLQMRLSICMCVFVCLCVLISGQVALLSRRTDVGISIDERINFDSNVMEK